MISVIIPAFNSEKSIRRAIESVLAQTYKDYKVIVVDDGSTDNTKTEIEKFGDKVNYIYQENSGPSVARNTALKYARGEWIAFLDADDAWLPRKLEKQMNLLQRNPELKWCCTNRYQSDSKRKKIVGRIKKIEKMLGGKEYFENYFLAAAKGCPMITTCLVVHSSIFSEVGGFDPKYIRGQDLDMWWRIAHRYPQIGYISQPLAVRYIDVQPVLIEQNRLGTTDGENRMQLISDHLEYASNYTGKEYFERYAAKRLLEGMIRTFYFGHLGQVRKMKQKFGYLLGWQWRFLITVALTFFPISLWLLKLAVKLSGRVIRT